MYSFHYYGVTMYCSAICRKREGMVWVVRT